LEQENEFIESTGCLIFDNNNRKIYCCLSERATVKALNVFMETINKYSKEPFELVPFKSTDRNDKPIYHTNCMMAMLKDHAVVCLSSIKDLNERIKVKALLEENRRIIDISFQEMENFCGNVINVRNKSDETVLIMSRSAQKGFSKKSMQSLKKSYKIIAPDVYTIEKIGGGSVRCMAGEFY